MARPKSFHIDSVLESATKVFWKQGFEATSMRDLEQATQLTPGSIYHEFGSKQGLFEQSLNFYVDSVMVWRVSHYLSSNEPMQGIRDFLVSSVKGVPKEFKGKSCLVVKTATELGQSSPSVNAIVKRGLAAIENGLKKQLVLAKSLGQVRADLDCSLAAKQLALLMSGMLVASKSDAPIKSLVDTVDFSLENLR